jgi:hypothetical protein
LKYDSGEEDLQVKDNRRQKKASPLKKKLIANISLSSFGARNPIVTLATKNKSSDYLNARLDVDDWGLNLLTTRAAIGTLTAELDYSAMAQNYLTFKAGDQIQVLKIR